MNVTALRRVFTLILSAIKMKDDFLRHRAKPTHNITVRPHFYGLEYRRQPSPQCKFTERLITKQIIPVDGVKVDPVWSFITLTNFLNAQPSLGR